ncbi:MAG TPA: CHASE4 domain-containing protein [Steroidobacteraceae bacterium]|nr:CHASE4 domain-containing protein [Steroidobacteraceae bacterium]
MSIRSKVIALIGAIFLILGLAQVLVEKQVVMPSFAELERADARTAMRRIEYALESTLNELSLSAADWGNWADTYRFVQDHNPEFIAANISNIALRELNANALIIVDDGGRFVQAKDLDLQSDQPLKLDLTTHDALPADFPWQANLRGGKAARGLLPTNKGILMLAAAPVLDGAGRGPSRGLVMIGRLLSPTVVRHIGAQAQAELAMLAPEEVAGQELVETDTQTRVYRAFGDVYGHPIMTLRVDVPRRITARGQAAVAYASGCLMAAAVIVLILLVMVLNRAILRPLALLTNYAVALGKDRDLTTRLDLKRRDEFGVLGREFDRMVERVAESRTQLVDQSFQAGFAELAKGVLHNLGNAMTPISVRLASLFDRLREAPAEDAEQAVAEMRGRVTDPQRAADLEQFVRLACGDLAGTVQAAREDVAVITRQTTVIQTMLAEQLRSARNEAVIEPVRLTELVAQSLEIVPDSCRQRLLVAADDTLRRVGVVRVARTVLRLTLQNLIINAADAVRDAGKEKGILRVSAEIVHAAEGQQLHLQCEDDGIGIPAQNLERVFEKGFSTKSPETNHGIGLHWCANAVGALGGRIWAASDGPGCGASLHLMVPLAGRETAPLAGAA